MDFILSLITSAPNELNESDDILSWNMESESDQDTQDGYPYPEQNLLKVDYYMLYIRLAADPAKN